MFVGNCMQYIFVFLVQFRESLPFIIHFYLCHSFSASITVLYLWICPCLHVFSSSQFCRFCWIVTKNLIMFCLSQENTKTKHPQLFYEAKLYNILQGGSMFTAGEMLSVMHAYMDRVIILLQTHACRWYCKHKMVRHRWRGQCSCSWFAWTEPRRLICLLWSEVLTEDSANVSRSNGTGKWHLLKSFLVAWISLCLL